jgi:hypothetical protein
VEKVHSTIKAIVRDWSDEGAAERQMSYGPIIDRLEKVFGGQKDRQDVKVPFRRLVEIVSPGWGQYFDCAIFLL